MRLTTRRVRLTAAALAAVTALGGLVACGGDAAAGKPAKLVVETFGEFGYDEIVKQYEKDTGITVELHKVAQLNDYRPKLVQAIATGTGAGDVVALEEGILNEFKVNPDNWVDLRPLVSDHSNDYLAWKYELGRAPNGRLMGLPTDVGSLAVCYRRDLFAAAGLPTRRDKVAALWRDWDGFIEAGEKYREATGKGMLDSVTTAASAVMYQKGGDLFYDDGDNIVADTSASVKAAWNTAIAMADAKISAGAATWSPEWSAGFKTGTFAATLCPSWMLGVVAENSGPKNAGKWDVAPVPGGAGNWGGSWLGVPTQSKYPEEAAKLAEYLTNARSQIAAFKLKGPLPTNLDALQDSEFTGYTNKYFNNAPTGKIFGESVRRIQPLHLGPKHQAVKENALEPALRAYESGELGKQAAWRQFVNEARMEGSFRGW
ncbi:extracellular solute-binding protein [Micromonospora sp. 15K316]|uniref:sugar ABC transporter substrate-binding protein n=1 Tax=Micromonospora sp. 15K316 TaxID=2530376 RepID=UPI00104960E0|nr:extracellular solute-binding protein [Micromonospora sp. 15K316]TDC29358.1 extracellular solute-binding protein [Micromonospora sp. 15K316]